MSPGTICAGQPAAAAGPPARTRLAAPRDAGGVDQWYWSTAGSGSWLRTGVGGAGFYWIGTASTGTARTTAIRDMIESYPMWG